MMRMLQRMLYAACLFLLSLPAINADTVTLVSSRDATMYEEFSSNGNGAGQAMFAGTNGHGKLHRALIGFDIAGNVPAGATITGVQLSLFLDRAGSGELNARQLELHRLLADWGEGTTGQGRSGS